MIPAAPDLFSTTTGVDIRSESRCAITRPAESVTPPAGHGTTILIGLFGYACAYARLEAQHMTAAASITGYMHLDQMFLCIRLLIILDESYLE